MRRRSSPNASRSHPSEKPPGIRERSAQATRARILNAAIKIFAKYGYDRGSVEKISSAAKSFDRMIYYYFGSKEELFIATLEEMYRRFAEAEASLQLDLDRPVETLKDVIRFGVRYCREHPEFVSLLSSENLHRGNRIRRSKRAREYSPIVIGIIENLIRAGAKKGLMRNDIRARDVYLMIGAMSYFHQSNRHTLSVFLDEKLDTPAAYRRWEEFVVEAVLRTVAKPEELQ